MNILSLSNDKQILDINSSVAGRIMTYGELVNNFVVLVPNRVDLKLELSKKVVVWGIGGNNKIWQFYKLYIKAGELLKNKNYQVITSQDTYFLGLLGYLLAKKYHLGLELQFHGVEKMAGLRKIISKYILPKANSVRTVSQSLKSILMDEFSVVENKIVVIPIYVAPCTNIEHLENNSKTFIFITACRLVPIKRVEWQIKAINNLKELSVELWIVGEGSEKNKLENLVKGYNLESKVKFLGWQNKEQLCDLYKQANCYILSSVNEGWGMATVEASYHQLPIIMTNVGCAREVFKNGESALIVESLDELIGAMKNIFANLELRKKLVAGAIGELNKLPDQEQTLNLYLTSLKKAVI